ncbi:DNA-dependent metalloprotease Wss1p [Monosporozyma servazzii]
MGMTIKKNPLINTITFLKKKPNSEYAFEILQDINNSVALLMRENNLKVSILAEFYPKQKNLLGLNVNSGYKIMLRIRQPFDDSRFLSREEIMNTMIHELTHNRVGPHNDKFRKQMREWCGRQYVIETLGLTENFLGIGKRLGGSRASGNYNIRQKRLQLLQQHSKSNNSSHSQKLDPTHSNKGPMLSPKEMAAKAAAERLQNKIPKEVYKINEDNNADEGVNVQEILSQHDMMDSQVEEIIIIDSESDNEGNTALPPKKDSIFIDLT